MLRAFFSSALGMMLAVPLAKAESPIWFFEHFTDGNLHDNTPVSWGTGGYGETLPVVNGDLMLVPGSEIAAAVVYDASYEDVSLLTRLGVSSPGYKNAGLIARQDGAVAYTAGITGNRFGVHDHSLVLTFGGLSTPNLEVLASAPTNLDPSKTDVLLQFDVVDDALSLFAWADGTPRPAQPQLAVHDGRIRGGSIGTFFDNDSGSAKAVFREFLAMPGQSTTTELSLRVHTPFSSSQSGPAIPEPNSSAAALIGIALALLRRATRPIQGAFVV